MNVECNDKPKLQKLLTTTTTTTTRKRFKVTFENVQTFVYK